MNRNWRYGSAGQEAPVVFDKSVQPPAPKEGTEMATAAAAYFPTHIDGFLWKLANAIVCDTKDVASELPMGSPGFLVTISTGFSAGRSILSLRGGFKRLANRQGRLLKRLSDSQMESWPLQACSEMAVLLDELLHDEHALITHASNSSGLVLFWWESPLQLLRSQVGELEVICHRIDALSVPESEMPGDADYREYMHLLNAKEEPDFSIDNDRRKARLFA